MPNVMAALPNIGGALCSTPQSLAWLTPTTSHYEPIHSLLIMAPYVTGQAIYFALWFLMVALCNIGQTIIFLPCSFFLPSIFFYSSPNLSGRRLDVYHTLTHGVALVRI